MHAACASVTSVTQPCNHLHRVKRASTSRGSGEEPHGDAEPAPRPKLSRKSLESLQDSGDAPVPSNTTCFQVVDPACPETSSMLLPKVAAALEKLMDSLEGTAEISSQVCIGAHGTSTGTVHRKQEQQQQQQHASNIRGMRGISFAPQHFTTAGQWQQLLSAGNTLCRFPLQVKASAFHGLRPPPITLVDYLQRIAHYTKCSPACFVAAIAYLDWIYQVCVCTAQYKLYSVWGRGGRVTDDAALWQPLCLLQGSQDALRVHYLQHLLSACLSTHTLCKTQRPALHPQHPPFAYQPAALQQPFNTPYCFPSCSVTPAWRPAPSASTV